MIVFNLKYRDDIREMKGETHFQAKARDAFGDVGGTDKFTDK